MRYRQQEETGTEGQGRQNEAILRCRLILNQKRTSIDTWKFGLEQSRSLEVLFPCLISAAPCLSFLQLCGAQGEHNELICNLEGIKVLLLLLAPEFRESCGSAEQEGVDVAPKGSQTRGCVSGTCIPAQWLLPGAMQCSWLFNKCAINSKILLQLLCLRETHILNKGISHIGSSGRIRVRVIMEKELKPVVLKRCFIKCGKQACLNQREYVLFKERFLGSFQRS